MTFVVQIGFWMNVMAQKGDGLDVIEPKTWEKSKYGLEVSFYQLEVDWIIIIFELIKYLVEIKFNNLN